MPPVVTFFHATCGTDREGTSLKITNWETRMSLSWIILIVVVLLLIGALPSWPYSTGWGYYPSGILGVIVVVVLVLALMGRI